LIDYLPISSFIAKKIEMTLHIILDVYTIFPVQSVHRNNMKIQFILHADFETCGAIEIWARENSFATMFCRPFAGDLLPVECHYDLLVVMGGPQSCAQINQISYLQQEILLIQETIRLGIPLLGICLGAQLIGESLGARVERSPQKEIGIFPIQLTEAGRLDPLLQGLPDKFLAMHWHNDMPGLTEEALVLATSKGCPRQIIRYNSRTYGFQCHVEMSKLNVESMIRHCYEDLSVELFVQPSEQMLNHDFAEINKNSNQILNNLLKGKK
jgi:GMP synthase (glutamine-hydrolysing)